MELVEEDLAREVIVEETVAVGADVVDLVEEPTRTRRRNGSQ